MWVISKITKAFKKKMLDVLAVYERKYNPKNPVICLDEKPKQLLKEIRIPLQIEPGKPQREDYEYEKHGTANIFVAVEPKGKHREVRVTPRRTMVEFALFIRYLVDEVYKTAEKIIFVMDNLNIHNVGSLLTIFGEKEGKRIASKLEWHWTPKHASWLNQAEIENHSLEAQCLKRRIPDLKMLDAEVTACVAKRNKKNCGINWQFTRKKAKKKFHLR